MAGAAERFWKIAGQAYGKDISTDEGLAGDEVGFHAHRIIGGNRDYRDLDLIIAAGHQFCAGSRSASAMHQQGKADCDGGDCV